MRITFNPAKMTFNLFKSSTAWQINLAMLCNKQSIATNEAQWPAHFSMHNWLMGHTLQLLSDAYSVSPGFIQKSFLYICNTVQWADHSYKRNVMDTSLLVHNLLLGCAFRYRNIRHHSFLYTCNLVQYT